ncbi:hypothetical protein L3X38_004846 [Prunus dulcis]|uniref:Uncharacterized protein n=1 Tax=Prunus dulcis TaxID=3755 RepID=A0AAD4ZPP2_PRUDU|nr:hypothetical protein L3X38_004846 [Prunus dulcis]
MAVDEKKKCQLFTCGLRPAICDIVVSQRIVDYSVLVMSATLLKSSQMVHKHFRRERLRLFHDGATASGSLFMGGAKSGGQTTAQTFGASFRSGTQANTASRGST